MTDIVIDGTQIHSESDFHRMLAERLDFGPYYGHNLDALWDRLRLDVERPLHLEWRHAEASRERLGPRFDAIVRVLQDVQSADAERAPEARFTLQLA